MGSVCWDAILEQAASSPIAAPLAELRRAHYEIVAKMASNFDEQCAYYKTKVHTQASEIETAAKETTEMLMGAEEMEKQFLKHLMMSMRSEDDEDALFSFLPKLETINGTSCSRMGAAADEGMAFGTDTR